MFDSESDGSPIRAGAASVQQVGLGEVGSDGTRISEMQENRAGGSNRSAPNAQATQDSSHANRLQLADLPGSPGRQRARNQPSPTLSCIFHLSHPFPSLIPIWYI